MQKHQICPMADETQAVALQEIAFCEHVLAKGGQNILTEVLRGAANVVSWQHYPEPDVFDPQTGAQWYYHCHDTSAVDLEHGHFHCFVRPEGVSGPIHHLCAVGVNAHGQLLRLFTVNQWVVDDDWLDAGSTLKLLSRFDVHMPRPSYLVNRWLTAIFAAYEPEIGSLISRRDEVLNAHKPPEGVAARADKGLEVTSELRIELKSQSPET